MAQFTQAQYDLLIAAIAEGSLKVEYGDKKVEYRSLNEMIRIRNIMARDLGISLVPKRTLASFSKGLFPSTDC